MATVDVVIVFYNSERHIEKCFSALEKQSCKDFVVIAVDNDSTDGTRKILKANFSSDFWKNRLRIVSLKENTGFAEGTVIGYRVGNSEFIVTLNIDTQPDREWLARLVEDANYDSEIGIYASKLIVHGSNRIDSAGDRFTMLLKGDKRGERQSATEYATKERVFGACAGAALYRRKMLEEIGFFDEDFFLIHEDTDLNFRAQLAGWKVLYVPTAIVHHKVRSSIGEMSDTAVYYSVRNCEFVRIKNVPFLVFLRCLPWFTLGEVTDFYYFALKHKKLAVFFRAKFDALRMLPRIWKKRKNIMKNRKVSNEYLLSIMTPVWDKNFLIAKCRKLIKH